MGVVPTRSGRGKQKVIANGVLGVGSTCSPWMLRLVGDPAAGQSLLGEEVKFP
jgi:hypothetical protein